MFTTSMFTLCQSQFGSWCSYYLYYFQVDLANVRLLQEEGVDALLEAEKEAEATKLALKRKIAQAASSDVDIQSRSLPAKLRIEPEDSEDVVSKFVSI